MPHCWISCPNLQIENTPWGGRSSQAGASCAPHFLTQRREVTESHKVWGTAVGGGVLVPGWTGAAVAVVRWPKTPKECQPGKREVLGAEGPLSLPRCEPGGSSGPGPLARAAESWSGGVMGGATLACKIPFIYFSRSLPRFRERLAMREQ